MSQTIERSWADARFAEGKEAGIAEGEARGEARGEAKGKAEAILRTLHLRLGPVPAEVAEVVNGIASEERLDALQDAAVLCEDLEDFRRRIDA